MGQSAPIGHFGGDTDAAAGYNNIRNNMNIGGGGGGGGDGGRFVLGDRLFTDADMENLRLQIENCKAVSGQLIYSMERIRSIRYNPYLIPSAGLINEARARGLRMPLPVVQVQLNYIPKKEETHDVQPMECWNWNPTIQQQLHGNIPTIQQQMHGNINIPDHKVSEWYKKKNININIKKDNKAKKKPQLINFFVDEKASGSGTSGAK
ncbi:hypothetical protein ACFE04_029881 [Oxalis oulophora]